MALPPPPKPCTKPACSTWATDLRTYTPVRRRLQLSKQQRRPRQQQQQEKRQQGKQQQGERQQGKRLQGERQCRSGRQRADGPRLRLLLLSSTADAAAACYLRVSFHRSVQHSTTCILSFARQGIISAVMNVQCGAASINYGSGCSSLTAAAAGAAGLAAMVLGAAKLLRGLEGR